MNPPNILMKNKAIVIKCNHCDSIVFSARPYLQELQDGMSDIIMELMDGRSVMVVDAGDVNRDGFCSCPQALRRQRRGYPVGWGGNVPFKIRLNMTVRSELPFDPNPPIAYRDTEYIAYTNQNGAVSARIGDSMLGLKPHEFEITEWYDNVVTNGDHDDVTISE